MIGELGENLVFLLGLPRSGTTLLSVLLNQHPDIHCPSEPWLMLALEAIGRTPDTDPHDAAVLYHAMEEFLTEDESIEAARQYARYAYNAKLKANDGKKIFVDKTPRYYLIMPFIHRVFPRARYLLLLRNPMDVAASMKNTWSFDLRHEFEHKQDALGSVDLNYGLRQMMSFACHPEHPAFFIRYEDLVRNPAKEMTKVFVNLGVRPTSELHFDVAHSSFATSSVGDRSIIGTHSPHQKSIDGWKRTFDKSELQPIIQGIGPKMMQDLGYGHTVDEIAAMGVEVGDESVALAHFKRQLDAVMRRVHKYMGCATFAGLMPARDQMAEVLDIELPLEPMARVKALTQRVKQLKEAAAAADRQAADQVAELRREVEALRAENARLVAALSDETTRSTAARNTARREVLAWAKRSDKMTRRVEDLIHAWPLRLAWGLRVKRPPDWIWKWGHPEPINVETDNGELELDSDVQMQDALSHLKAKGFTPRIVLDIGAAKGYWSEKVQYHYYYDAQYYMIDPQPESEQRLATLAKRSGKFHYLLTAVGAAAGPATRGGPAVETIDGLIEQGKLPPPDLVKIDAHGAELEVLRGGGRMLESATVVIVPVKLFQFTPETALADQVITFMAEKGFRVFDIAGILRRPYQDDLAQIHVVFVKNGSDLVSSNRWR